MTYSLIALDREAGAFGIVVQSHWFSVGSVVPHVRPGVGAVATQSVPDPAHGPRILDALERGATPDEAIDAVLSGDDAVPYRQIAVVDAEGRVAVHTGEGCVGDAGHHVGEGWAAQANMMSTAEVWPAMAEAYAAADGTLGERLLAALDAGEAAGGDVRGKQSAALVVAPAQGEPWARLCELRVEDHADPNAELRRLLVLNRAFALAGEADELMAEGHAEEAGRRYEEAAELAPQSGELLFWSGLFAASLGQLDAGVERVKRSFALEPRMRDLLPRLGEDIAPGAGALRDALG